MSYYVDNTATNGLATGTSWANAWIGPDTINWSFVNPGDTVYISGGRTSQLYAADYNHSLLIGKNGVTISIGQDPDHSGLAILSGQYVDASGRSNVRITGHYMGQPRLMLADFYDPVNRTLANKVYADGSSGLQIDFCVISNVNQCVSLVGASTFNVLSNLCYARGDAAVRAVNCPDLGFDSHYVRGNVIILDFCTNTAGYYGPDGVQGSHGITVCSNLFTIRRVGYLTSTQHPDYTQIIGNHVKIVANHFLNIGDSGNDFDWWANPTPHDILIANNIYEIQDAIDPYPEYIRWYVSAGKSITSLANLQIINNTFINNRGWPNIYGTWGASTAPAVAGCVIANNTFCGGAFAISNIVSLTASSITLSNNVYDPSFTYFWRDTNYTGTAMLTIDPAGIAGYQSYVGVTNYHLAKGSLGIGKALPFLSSFRTDKDSVPRLMSWDVGAYQYVPVVLRPPSSFNVNTL